MSRSPKIGTPHSADRLSFENEFYRYFGAPIAGGGTGVFSPLGGEWKGENYIQSTVYGRLLNGSHWWTSPENGFLIREGQSTANRFPAKFSVSNGSLNRLFLRTSPPCLKHDYRLPIEALAVYYFRQQNLDESQPKTIDDIVSLFQDQVISRNQALSNLFRSESLAYWGSLFSTSPMTEVVYRGCYPLSTHAGKPKTRLLIYADDVDRLRSKAKPGETDADTLARVLEGP